MVEHVVETSLRALVSESAVMLPGSGGSRLGGSSPGRFSIRIPSPAIGVQCAACGQSFWAAGPTGFEDDAPICDTCLLERSHGLGMLLALALVNRQFANLVPRKDGEYELALQDIGQFAALYEHVALKEGPPRRFELPSQWRDPQG